MTDALLGVRSSALAFAGLLPNAVGRTQGMALTARFSEVGAAVGIGQGTLAGDRQNLHALIKVMGPTLYGSLFAFGCRVGRPELPFIFASTLAGLATIVALLTPNSVWRGVPVEAGTARRSPPA